MIGPQDIFCAEKARAFTPFLCAKSDKLLELIAEVRTQMNGYETFHQTRKRARRCSTVVLGEETHENSGRA